MNHDQERTDNKEPAREYLDDTEDRYIFDPASGLYKPKTYEGKNPINEQVAHHIFSGSVPVDVPQPFKIEIGKTVPVGNSNEPLFVEVDEISVANVRVERDLMPIWVSIVALLISAITVALLYKTVYFARKQWKEAQTTATQSVVSANAARSAANSAENAIKSSDKNAKADLRAYVVALATSESVDVGCDPTGSEFCVNLHYANVGRTPAIGVTVNAFVHFDTFGNESVSEQVIQHLSIGKYDSGGGGVVGNTPATMLVQTTGREKTKVRPCMRSYHTYGCGYTIYGVIRYQDIFRSGTNETGFCMYFPLSAPSRFCTHGNWFDIRPKGYTLNDK